VPVALAWNARVARREELLAADTSVPGGGDRHQRVETVNLTYNFLGHTRFGAVEWRPAELAAR